MNYLIPLSLSADDEQLARLVKLWPELQTYLNRNDGLPFPVNASVILGTRKLEVGMTLYGFCGGFFGRDDYDDKIITEIGPDYVVARVDGTGSPRVAHLDPGRGWEIDDLLEYTTKPEDEYE